MTSIQPATLRAAGALCALLAVLPCAARADVSAGSEKKGFIGRLFGGKKDEAPPPVEAPPPAAEPKPGPPAKVTTKSTPKASAKSAPAKKTSPKPAATAKSEPKKSEAKPAESKTAAAKPAAKPEPKQEEAKPVAKAEPSKAEAKPAEAAKPAVKVAGSGAYAQDRGEIRPPPPPAPLPPAASQSGGWQIVKINGRDYITGESLHQFYRFSSYKVDGKHVWLRSNNLILKGTIGSQELLINNIKFILSYPVQSYAGRALFSRIDLCKLIDPVLRPTHISDAVPFDTVVVDAGHGGHDAGARGIYGYEKDFALLMARTVRDALQARGFKVIMTRDTDTFVTLSGRVAVANRTPNSIFLSLHFNAGSSSQATGIETFALTPQGSSASLERGGGYNANGLTGNAHDSANIALATAVHAMVISKFRFVDRGIKRAQWSVLTGCKRPGILFEGGFVTNPNECRLVASDTYRKSVSSAIADAIVNYRTALRGALTRRQ
jgi:N-acetylmuramoyl-L-alanine amidase